MDSEVLHRHDGSGEGGTDPSSSGGQWSSVQFGKWSRWRRPEDKVLSTDRKVTIPFTEGDLKIHKVSIEKWEFQVLLWTVILPSFTVATVSNPTEFVSTTDNHTLGNSASSVRSFSTHMTLFYSDPSNKEFLISVSVVLSFLFIRSTFDLTFPEIVRVTCPQVRGCLEEENVPHLDVRGDLSQSSFGSPWVRFTLLVDEFYPGPGTSPPYRKSSPSLPTVPLNVSLCLSIFFSQ